MGFAWTATLRVVKTKVHVLTRRGVVQPDEPSFGLYWSFKKIEEHLRGIKLRRSGSLG